MEDIWLLDLFTEILSSANDISYLGMADKTHALLSPAVLLYRYCHPARADVLFHQEMKAIRNFVSMKEIIHDCTIRVVFNPENLPLRSVIGHGSILAPFVHFFETVQKNFDQNAHQDIDQNFDQDVYHSEAGTFRFSMDSPDLLVMTFDTIQNDSTIILETHHDSRINLETHRRELKIHAPGGNHVSNHDS